MWQLFTPRRHLHTSHTSIPHTHQLDTPVQTRAWTQCGLLVRDSLIFARQGRAGGCSQCPCDDGLQDAGDNHICKLFRRYPFEDIRARVSYTSTIRKLMINPCTIVCACVVVAGRYLHVCCGWCIVYRTPPGGSSGQHSGTPPQVSQHQAELAGGQNTGTSSPPVRCSDWAAVIKIRSNKRFTSNPIILCFMMDN